MTIFMQFDNCRTTILVGISWKLVRFTLMGDNRGVSYVDTSCQSFQPELYMLVTTGFSISNSFKEIIQLKI